MPPLKTRLAAPVSAFTNALLLSPPARPLRDLRQHHQMRRRVAIGHPSAERVVRHVTTPIDRVSRDRGRQIRGIEDPPAAFAPPVQPGVARLRPRAEFADHIKRTGITQTIVKPERFRLAIPRPASSGQSRWIRAVRIAGRVAKRMGNPHQPASLGGRRLPQVQPSKDCPHRPHVPVVRGKAGRLQIERPRCRSKSQCRRSRRHASAGTPLFRRLFHLHPTPQTHLMAELRPQPFCSPLRRLHTGPG